MKICQMLMMLPGDWENAINDRKHMQAVLDKLPAELNDAEQEQATTLLLSYADVFSKGEFDIGRTEVTEMTIDTGNNRPIRQPLRRHPVAQLGIIDRQVEDMLASNLIEPAVGPWASNVVLVKRKDGQFRFCVDYRSVNSCTYKDAYPLPNIGVCLDALNGASWFTTLDLRAGYHNIPIAMEDRDKTAFITRRGMFRYRVCPFGLTCGPAVMQRLMDLVLTGLTLETCLVYLDDCIIFARSFSELCVRVGQVLERFRQAGLKLKGSKCSFFSRRVSFLGHVVSEKGLELQDDKMSAIRDWPVPRNCAEIQSFLGLCSYYRRFVQDFATIAAPLHALTHKQTSFTWGPEQQQAFDKLKGKLISAPIVALPRMEGKYLLDSDASTVGLGAVLSQEQDGVWKVIGYASRTLNAAEKNYCTTRLELLAVKFGLTQFRHLLLCRKFVIRTDHSALLSLRRNKEPTGQQARLLMFLESFDFDIVHRPGRVHLNADVLSRRPCRQCGLCSATNDIVHASAVTTRRRAEERECNEQSSVDSQIPTDVTRIQC